MLDKMKQMKQLLDMQRKAKTVQKELRDTEIEAVSADGKITVVFNGELKLVDLRIAVDYLEGRTLDNLEKSLKITLTEGLSRAQQIAAERTRGMMKEMNINFPGV